MISNGRTGIIQLDGARSEGRGSAARRSRAAIAAQSPQVRFPDPDIGVTTLNARARAQRASVDRFKVVYDFQFTDRVKESGITFVHRVVDDAGVAYKPVHYDHGNGIAVADVDGDGLPDIYFANQIGGNQLWKNLGGGRFADITKEAGVALADRISVTASFADVDNDGDEDLFVTTVRGGNVLFENDGHGHFQRHLEGGRRRLRRPLVGRGVLRLRPRRPAGPVRLQRRPLHDRRARARRRVRRPGRRVLRPPPSRSVGDRDPLQEPRRPAVPRRHRGRWASATPAGAATPAWPI